MVNGVEDVGSQEVMRPSGLVVDVKVEDWEVEGEGWLRRGLASCRNC